MMYIDALAKVKAAHARKIKRLEKRLALAKGKPKKVSMKALKKELRVITHRIVRNASSNCYTCGKHLEPKDRQAGHYWSDGAHSAVRYSFENLRTQCVSCNMFKSGNLAEFGIRLLKELGKVEFEALAEKAHQPKKWARGELMHLIEERKAML